MRTSLFVLTIALGCFSCNKENARPTELVEIYLLKNYQAVSDKCQVNAAVSTLQDTPVIKNQDITGYSKANYQFTLSDAAIEKVKAFTDHTPFAVTVDKAIIYYAIYKPAVSSSSCENSITMDIDPVAGNKIF